MQSRTKYGDGGYIVALFASSQKRKLSTRSTMDALACGVGPVARPSDCAAGEAAGRESVRVCDPGSAATAPAAGRTTAATTASAATTFRMVLMVSSEGLRDEVLAHLT
jgi:hypothetical protein